MGIPTMANSRVNFSSQQGISQDTTLRNRIDSDNVFEMIQQGLKRGRIESIDDIKCINLQVLLSAPEDFFDKYETIVERMTGYIQNYISANNSSSLISALRTDPTNRKLRTDVFTAIYSAYLTQEGTVSIPNYINLSQIEKDIVFVLVFNEISGMGPLEPLFQDFTVREIICNGPKDIQADINARPVRVPSCKFRDANHLNNLIKKLYSSINKEVTRMNPGERGRLPDNSRIFAVDSSLAPGGPTLNIRRHTEDWISPDTLMRWGVGSEEVFEWIGSRINAGMNFVISGGTSSGKTTLVGALSAYYRKDVRILTAERNIEMKLCPNKLWGVPMEVIPPKPSMNFAGIPLRTIVEFMTQMRPDGCIIGEVTGEETYDLLNFLNTGHFGCTTTHSNSAVDCINRIITLASLAGIIKGADLLGMISSSFDFIIQIEKMSDGVRRITEIVEVDTEVTQNQGGQPTLKQRPIWRFKQTNTTKGGEPIVGHWEKVGEISEERLNKRGLNSHIFANMNELRALYSDI